MFDDTSNTTTAYLSGTNVYGYGMGIQKKAPGTLTITGNSDGASRIESKASYTIHQSGGTITLGNGAATGTGETSVILGDHATSASALYLSGGTMNYGQNTAIYAKGSNGSVMPVTIAGATMNLQGGVIRSIQSGGSSFNRTSGTLNITGKRGQTSGSKSYTSWNQAGTISTTYYNYRKS